ncbi:MAG TPA: hypothetical protein PLZ58_00905 [Candidatus Saccharibacteria bacterium]|nr:hypothetical protein [Candidatus Saccharibacteria bacterium]HRQ07120.1 hypothetical protein [Candidatus Saccharibacteria bacterium]
MAILGAITQYKLGRSTKQKSIIRISLWILIAIGLALSQTIYEWMFSHSLTQTEPLSLFDVVQITAIVVVFYIANRTRSKIDILEKRVQDLHQELSVRLSDIK